MSGTLERVQRVAVDVFGSDDLGPDAAMGSVENWDSVNHLNFVLALEGEFGLSFEPEEIEKMTSLKKAAEVVERKKG